MLPVDLSVGATTAAGCWLLAAGCWLGDTAGLLPADGDAGRRAVGPDRGDHGGLGPGPAALRAAHAQRQGGQELDQPGEFPSPSLFLSLSDL